MIVSVNWLKQFTQIDMSVDELAAVIGARLVEIEGVEALGGKYKDVVVARIVESRPIEDSDHLNLTRIDDGGAVPDVERGDDGLVQVVCGAPNVREGMMVAWLPPKSTVPETAGEPEPFVLGARKLRGYVSNGMLASARELDLFDSHDGIVEIDKDVSPGTPFAAAYALDDYLLDIENKSLTHRPDTFGIIGFAREVAAIAGKGFTVPEWVEDLSPDYGRAGGSVGLSVAVDTPELSARYQAVALELGDPRASTPLEIQTYLSRSGIRPISLVVDVTNYLMLLTGQPLHAFDYDKVAALGSTHLHVRGGHDGETLNLLDGRTITLDGDDIVVAAGETAVALAGAMGGADTEIGADTTRIIIESATFDLYHLRRTQMRHGVFSEAVTRFTKGQSAAQTALVLARALSLLGELAGAVRISDVADDYPVKTEPATLGLTVDRVNGLLGTRYSADDVAETLSGVGFDVAADGGSLTVTPPYWRTDISIAEDVIEEVGRLGGFDLIEPTLARRDVAAVEPDAGARLRRQVRDILSAAGANEALTYSFVHGDLLMRAGQSPDASYALANAISPTLQYYRQSLTPSLLDKVTPNLRQKFDEFGLFELGATHVAGVADGDEPDVPAEFGRLGFVYAASGKAADGRGAAYYTARTYAAHLLKRLNVAGVRFEPLSDATIDVAAAPFEPKRSAAVYAGESYLGIVGEYRPHVVRAFKLPSFCAGFEFLLGALADVVSATGRYVSLSRYPSSGADVTFAVPAGDPFSRLDTALADAAAAENLDVSAVPTDMYAPATGGARNITFRLTVVSYDGTLAREDINGVVARITSAVTGSTGYAVV